MTGDDSPRQEIRRSYDQVAADYLAHFRDELEHKPLDRALLGMLADDLPGDSVVGDLGSGPGHIAGWLAGRGVRTVAVDLSPEMVAVGSLAYPAVDFRVGDLIHVPAADGEFGAVVCFYALIHLQAAELPAAIGEIHRVLRPGGTTLVAFHVGSDVIHRDEWWGHEVDVDFRFLEPAQVAAVMTAAGLEIRAELIRAPYPDEAATRRAYLLAVRPERA